MTEEIVLAFGREALVTALLVTAPVLGLGLAVGLIISIIQATTQIHEQTLTFVPRIVVILVAIAIFAPWMMRLLLDFATRVFANLPNFAR